MTLCNFKVTELRQTSESGQDMFMVRNWNYFSQKALTEAQESDHENLETFNIKNTLPQRLHPSNRKHFVWGVLSNKHKR
jgi:hypothetical protein